MTAYCTFLENGNIHLILNIDFYKGLQLREYTNLTRGVEHINTVEAVF